MVEPPPLLPSSEKREGPRYPCVGIALIYSAVLETNVARLGSALHHAALIDMSLQGMSFDVDAEQKAGQALIVLVEQPNGAAHERLVTEVCWCIPLELGAYRVGVRIQASDSVRLTDFADADLAPIGIGPAMPVGAELRCPACDRDAAFKLVGQQSAGKRGGVIPLYDCSLCGSTRSITSILSHARQEIGDSNHAPACTKAPLFRAE